MVETALYGRIVGSDKAKMLLDKGDRR
jgi:hypothetical protein